VSGNPWTVPVLQRALPLPRPLPRLHDVAGEAPPRHVLYGPNVGPLLGSNTDGGGQAESAIRTIYDAWDPPRHLVARVCDAMAREGELAALRTLVEGGCGNHMDGDTLAEAVEGGSVECVRWVHNRPLSLPCVCQTLGQ
jgi:hypothetical protein